MSGNDPFDPFGQNERTIIRPNPGGRAPQQPAPGQQPAPQQPAPQQPMPQQPPPQGQPAQPTPYTPNMTPGGGAAPGQTWNQPGDYAQQPNHAPVPGGQMVPPGGQVPPGAPPGGYQQQPMGGAPVQNAAMPGNNPLITAAGPLLDLMGRLRNAMTQATFTNLKMSISREIEAFDGAATAAGANQQQLPAAKYALCATADDIVQNLPGEDRHVWTQDPMLGRYFGERIGGTRFYENLGEAMKNPGGNYDLLELMYVCLSLGFEGMHRASPQGAGAVQAARRDVHQALRGVTHGGGWAISPNWKGMDVAARSLGMQIPFWAVAALVALLMAGAFFGMRYMLAEETGEVTVAMAKVHPELAVEIERERPAPPPPPPPPPVDTGQLDRIREALAAEIAQGLVEAEYLDANFIIVRFSNKLLFPSGKAEVNANFRDVLAPRIGETFNRETEILRAKGYKHGRVVAIGHSDAQPISSASRWGSNHGLSEARAKSVMDAVVVHSPPDLRTIVEGRGPDDPICTPAEDTNCWPTNRRVEFLIERTL
ncbi:MAG: type IVB secretion system protein IcmH/DotU [Pseudomonadota bacterium]